MKIATFLALACGCAASTAAQGARYTLIPQTFAAQHGLVRAWATQVSFDTARGRLKHLSLQGGLLFAVSDLATVQALDPETGRTVWTTKVGNANYPTTAAAGNEKYVAVCNGSTVYVLNREDGGVLLERRTMGVPLTGPAVTNDWVYVPMINGAIEGYNTKSATKPVISFHGNGMVAVPPQVAAGNVIWGTERGYVYACKEGDMAANFRFVTRGAIEARLAYIPPYIITGSTDGFIYALNASNGKRAWEFSTGSPVRGQPVGIENVVYTVAPAYGMLCLTSDHGALRWFAPDIYYFVAASKSRVYASDSVGRMVVLDAKGGARVDSLPTELLTVKLINATTDRIYLATPTGLLQCLHEVELTKPIFHAPSAMPPTGPPASAAPATKDAAEAEAPPAEPAQPEAPPPAEGDKDPFGPKEPKAPAADKPAEGADPFAKPPG